MKLDIFSKKQKLPKLLVYLIFGIYANQPTSLKINQTKYKNQTGISRK